MKINPAEYNMEGFAIEAWMDAMPDDPYAPCPCGCGKKWRFAMKETPDNNIMDHIRRFIDNFMKNPPDIEEKQVFEKLYTEILNEGGMAVTENTIDGIPYELYQHQGHLIRCINVGAIDNSWDDYDVVSKRVQKWVQEHNAHFFSAGKEESGYFPLIKGVMEAIKLGKDILVYENLS